MQSDLIECSSTHLGIDLVVMIFKSAFRGYLVGTSK